MEEGLGNFKGPQQTGVHMCVCSDLILVFAYV